MLFFCKSFRRNIDFDDWDLPVSNFYLLDFLLLNWNWIFGHFGTFQMLIFVMKFLQYIFQDGLDLLVFLFEENLFFLHHFKHSLTFFIQIFELIVLVFLFFECCLYFGQLKFELLIFLYEVLGMLMTERFGLEIVRGFLGLLSLLVWWWGIELLFKGLKIDEEGLECRGRETGRGKGVRSGELIKGDVGRRMEFISFKKV